MIDSHSQKKLNLMHYVLMYSWRFIAAVWATGHINFKNPPFCRSFFIITDTLKLSFIFARTAILIVTD